MTDVTPDMVIQKVLDTRAQVKAIAERHQQELAPHQDVLARCEAWLLGHLNINRIDSVGNREVGVAYRSTTLSATVSQDGGWDLLLSWIVGRALERALSSKEQGASEQDAVLAFLCAPEIAFFNRAVNKTAVKDMMEATKGKVPPGVNVTQIVNVNIRKA